MSDEETSVERYNRMVESGWIPSLDKAKEILAEQGYLIIAAKRVKKFAGVDVIDKNNLDLIEKDLYPQLIQMRSMVLAGRMAKEMVNNKAFTFTERDNANHGKFVNGEITVILPEEN